MKLALVAVVVSACASHTATPKPATPVVSASKLDELVARCERDHDPAACYAAAYVFDNGPAGVQVDHERADRLAKHGVATTVYACKNRNDALSCRVTAAHIKLALTRVEEGERRQQLVAHFVTIASAGCFAGDLDLCLDASAVLYRGEAGKADPDYARVLTEHACELDSQEACVDLAILIVGDARSSADDHTHAVTLLEHACERARGDGCGTLATIRLRESRTDDARRFAARACELRDGAGCAVLGHCLLDGLGGPSDRSAAVVAFRTACTTGDDRGCQMLTSLGEPR